MALERLYINTEQYFALPYASNSTIKDAHKLMKTGTIEEHGTFSPAYYFGSAMDALLTEPELIHTVDMDQDQRKEILPMIASLQRNNTYQTFFSPEAGRESQAVFVDLEFPITIDGMKVTIPVKCKFDWWNPKRYINFGGDLKTTDASTEAAFLSAANWFYYPQQAAWYMDITGTDRFVIMAVSKRNNHVFTLPIKRGDKLYEKGKADYLRCSASWFKLNGSAA